MPYTTLPTWTVARLRASQLTTVNEAIEEARPVGEVVARHRRTTTSSTTTSEVGVARLDNVPLTGGWLYRIYTSDLYLVSTTSSDVVAALLHINASGTATTSSTVLAQARVTSGASGEAAIVSGLYAPASDESLSVLLSVARESGGGNASISAGATFPIDLIVQCVGIDPGSSGTNI